MPRAKRQPKINNKLQQLLTAVNTTTDLEEYYEFEEKTEVPNNTPVSKSNDVILPETKVDMDEIIKQVHKLQTELTELKLERERRKRELQEIKTVKAAEREKNKAERKAELLKREQDHKKYLESLISNNRQQVYKEIQHVKRGLLF